MTGETCEGIEAFGGAVLRLAVGEAGGASEPAPIGGAAICAELVGKRFRGKGAKLFGKRPRMAKPCLKAAGACLDHGGGAIALGDEAGESGRGEIV